jgi:haloalkane dehalogenase
MTTSTETRRVPVTHPGGSLHVADHAGEEPAVVAMHGFPDDHHIYDRLIPDLAGRRVVTFDWLGYGRSDRRDPTTLDPSDRQRDLTAVLDQLDLHDVVLVGHDASGPEAVDLALTHPDRVRGLVLLNTYYGHAPALRLPEMIALIADPAYKTLTDGLLDDEGQRLWLLDHQARQMGLDPDDPTGIGAASILPQFFGDTTTPHALGEIRAWLTDLHAALDRQDERIATGQLAALPIPVTVAFGSEDPYLNPDLACHLAGLFGDARLRLVRGASHWPQWQQPQAVADLIANSVRE